MINRIDCKTQSAINALNYMKRMTKKQVIRFEDIIKPASKELLEKRTYMQSAEFYENPENVRKMEWGEVQAALRNYNS